MQEETAIFYPISLTAWRKWLEKNHLSKQSVWLVFYNKNASKKSISWSNAVDVALCYGWIDSKKIKIDEETSHQFSANEKQKAPGQKLTKKKL